MKKAIYIALTWLAAGGSVYAANAYPITNGVSLFHSYTHLIETNQSQTSESLSLAALEIKRPVPLQSFPKLAAVNFAVGNDFLEFNTPEFIDRRTEQCKNLGFTLTSCSNGTPSSFCPYDNSYFASCCDPRYQYSKSNCFYPNTISGDSCGGKYMCYCDRSLYPITSCESPKIVSEDKCMENGIIYYASCSCPANYTETCEGMNLQGRLYADLF